MTHLTPEEIRYLIHVLYCADNFTVARGEQVITSGVKHKDLLQKLEDYEHRIRS